MSISNVVAFMLLVLLAGMIANVARRYRHSERLRHIVPLAISYFTIVVVAGVRFMEGKFDDEPFAAGVIFLAGVTGIVGLFALPDTTRKP